MIIPFTVRCRLLMSLTLLTVLTTHAFTQQPPGGDNYVFPPGGKAGTTVDVRLGGADWTPDLQFFVHDHRVKLEVLSKPGEVLLPEAPFWFGIKSYANDPRLPREVSARFVLPDNLPPGLIHWSVANANGAGNGGVFVVGTGHEIIEDEFRNEPQKLTTLPVTVNGRLRRIEEVDRYRFVATRSGPVTCELMARRLGSDFLGCIEVQDADGKRVAEVVDTEGNDPALTFYTEKGKAYTVGIRDVDYRGYRNFTYRLTLTPGPGIITSLPAAGQRGKKSQLEFIGTGIATGQARLESVTRDIEFPNDKKRETYSYRMETPFGVTPEFTLPLSDILEQRKPASTELKDRRYTVPFAVTGQIDKRGERDIYVMAGKKGEVWEITVQSKKIGSPLEINHTVIGPDGKPLATKDDSVTLPADGDYRMILSDVSGKSLAANSVYRLEVKRPAPGFQLRTVGIINVPIGGKTSFTLRIIRQGGFKEPVALSFTGLPEGITPPKELVIPPTVDALPITLECTKEAVPRYAQAQLVGKAIVGGQAIEQTIRADFSGDLTSQGSEVNLFPHVLVATTMKPPIKVKVAEADGGRRIPRGSTHLTEILIERTDGFKGEIQLDMAGNQQRHRQGIRGPAVVVAPGATKFDYPVFLPEWLETSRTSRIGLVAIVQAPDVKGNLHYVMTPVEGQVTMSIEGALMKLSNSANELSVISGRPLEIPLILSRSKILTEPIKVELIVPAELKGLVTAKPLNWPMDKNSVNWTVETIKDSKLIGIRQLIARATTMKQGHAVVSETTFEVEFVSEILKSSSK